MSTKNCLFIYTWATSGDLLGDLKKVPKNGFPGVPIGDNLFYTINITVFRAAPVEILHAKSFFHNGSFGHLLLVTDGEEESANSWLGVVEFEQKLLVPAFKR